MKTVTLAILVGSILATGGCSTLFRGPPTHAASPMTLDGPVKFDLVALLDPTATASGAPGELERALAEFDATQANRNRVVGAMLIGSDRNCDVYLENLRGFQSGWRTGFGLASVGLGAAGAIVTGADTSQLLSGLAGASSGVVGKLDENLMGGLAAEVLVAGVRAGREPIRRDLVLAMQTPYDAWPVEVAIADVLRYHGRCNVMSGLTTAQRAVEQERIAPTERPSATPAEAAGAEGPSPQPANDGGGGG